MTSTEQLCIVAPHSLRRPWVRVDGRWRRPKSVDVYRQPPTDFEVTYQPKFMLPLPYVVDVVWRDLSMTRFIASGITITTEDSRGNRTATVDVLSRTWVEGPTAVLGF